MATATSTAVGAARFLETERKDAWWATPLLTFAVLSAFVAYATFRVFENDYYGAFQGRMEYHTPFGSPDFTGFVPGFLLAIPVVGGYFGYPAVLILPFVAGFRFTCYYYRKAYYRSFAARPAGCGVGASAPGKYAGEKRVLLFQNLHRYFLYAALVVLVFNLVDAVFSVATPEHDGLYFGLGTVIMALNVVFLSSYTLGCHSFRHLVGGKLDCFSCDAASHFRHRLWGRVTMLNNRHQMWAWISLVWVAFTDFYIRFLASHPEITTVWGVPA